MGESTRSLSLEERIRVVLAFKDPEHRVRAMLDIVADAVDEAIAGTDADTHPLRHVAARPGGVERIQRAVRSRDQAGAPAEGRLDAVLGGSPWRDPVRLAVPTGRVFEPAAPHRAGPTEANGNEYMVQAGLLDRISDAVDEARAQTTLLDRIRAWSEDRRRRGVYAAMRRDLEESRTEPLYFIDWR